MKHSTLSLAIVVGLGLTFPAFADQSEDIELLKKQVRDLQIKTGGNNLNFSVDYRVTLDSIEYTLADGSTAENDGLLANRLLLNMGYKYNDNLVFKGQLSYSKAYGEAPSHSTPSNDDFDWVNNENLQDNTLRVKEAYFLYLGDAFLGNSNIPWTFSLGRRPSTNGFLANNREGFEEAQSPLAHSINVEFDGLSLNTKLEEVIGLTGSSVKLCAGRGLTNANGRFDPAGLDYATNDNQTDDIDMLGFIVTPYNNGQYNLQTQIYTANNMIGLDMNRIMSDGDYSFYDFGNLSNFTISLEVNGIGEFISDFLDDTRVFISYSMSKTDPDDGMAMLGSTESETGNSYWIGVNVPGPFEGDSFGIEFNHGSKYWRSFTYGEDTMIGSKIAARGDAFEVYYNYPIIDEALTFQLRYTKIDYDYTGSNGFFGSATGTPMTIEQAYAMSQMLGMPVPVESASDIRATLRYKF
ncbi:DUF3373 family protein [Teredinibacter sp. KSP-S5-2]|uniref:DUF3373 family protein n=1 Tax=Teredinibacter sp. KSP-S5-2 TaxID=3034506 RepID=UPI002934F0A5|nr:DUF3373 family protein [Teredinibacter sp. KSP-S5-2]WNO10063.1 DUF3373 family protein [Teredinibacter sp. KSP-S5-2]